MKNNIVYSELELDFDENIFVDEFDKYILSNTVPHVRVHAIWNDMAKLNKYWNIISDEEYNRYDKIIASGNKEASLDGMTHYWTATNLMAKKFSTPSNHLTGSGWRANMLSTSTVVKDEYKNLQIIDWIFNKIPHERIIGIHCTVTPPGVFVAMHRDVLWKREGDNPSSNNGFFNKGYKVICLNISNGGVPLLWSLDHEKESPRIADTKCYMISDYFLHGLTRTTSIRRQLRVSFKPSKDFFNYIKQDTAISLPSNYVYQ